MKYINNFIILNNRDGKADKKKVLEESEIWVEAQKLTKDPTMNSSHQTPSKQKMYDVAQIESNMINDTRYNNTNQDISINTPSNQDSQTMSNNMQAQMFPQGMFMPQMMQPHMQGAQNGQPQMQYPMMMMPQQQMGNSQAGNFPMQNMVPVGFYGGQPMMMPGGMMGANGGMMPQMAMPMNGLQPTDNSKNGVNPQQQIVYC